MMLDIAEIARATGLSSRALRFYEARGLIRPLRSEGGRRIFGAGELERLHAIIALKRAGFTLAAIGGCSTGRARHWAR
ncbi:MerR family transcriptional regulator [Sphingomonas sp. I4]